MDHPVEVALRNVRAGRVNAVGLTGFFWFARDLMGEETLGVPYYEQPDLVPDIAETRCSLLEEVLDTALGQLESVGIGLDKRVLPLRPRSHRRDARPRDAGDA